MIPESNIASCFNFDSNNLPNSCLCFSNISR